MLRCCIIVLLITASSVARATDNHYDYARVIAAEPIIVSERVPVRRQVCDKPSSVSPPGDARRDRPAASIGDLINTDNKQRKPACRNVTRYEKREKNIGWRVTYQYAGTEYVRRMKEKPGKRIRVKIDLDAR